MSAKSRERREKHHAREQAAQSSQNASPPTSNDGQYIHPIMIHPIEYHNSPVPVQEIPRPDAAASAPHRPTAASSFFPDEQIESQFIRKKPQAGFDTSHFDKKDERVNAADLTADWNQEMENALAPRTASGTPLTNMSIGTVARVQIPAFTNPSNPTPENPIRPIVYAEEFSNGNTPEGFHYADGYAECKMGPDGNPVITTMYADPVRNLTAQDQAALELGRKLLQSDNAAQQTSPIPEDPLAEDTNLDELDVLETVIDRPRDGCLYYIGKKRQIKLTNFRLNTIESRLIISKHSNEPPSVEYLVRIICGYTTRDITITPHELDNAVRKIQTEHPSCIILPGVTKANQCITNFLRQQLAGIPQKVYIERTGFIRLSDGWVYVHDRAVPPDPNTVFNTGRYIPDRFGVTDAQAFHDAFLFLDITHRDELIIPLFLLAHLGPLFQLFHEAGRTPRFVTINVGRSGSLKTSMSLVLFRLFSDQGRTPTATFKDTEAALEIKLGQLGGTTGIFDDFRPPVSDLKSKVNAEKLESIIRAVGDHVSKARSTVKLDRAKEFVPSGCVLVTAEDLSGSHSSYLRSLILSISKGDIDGSKLRFFQNNPDIIPAHMNRFLRWIGQHGDEVINRIRFEYPAAQFENTVTELRLVDTAATLMMTAHLLASYAEACGAMTSVQSQGFLSRCYTAISTAVVASEAMSKDANPCVMHLEALFSLMDRGEIRLAENMKMYVAEFHDGFLSDQCAWLDADTIYAKVTKHYSRLNITFPLQERQLAVHLSDAQLIDVATETRKDGSTKRLYRRKSSLPSRKAMQVLHLDRAMAYLEENGNN